MPLGVAVPLTLSGTVTINRGVIEGANIDSLGAGVLGMGNVGVQGVGIDEDSNGAGKGVRARGGNGNNFKGGAGMESNGGISTNDIGGTGVNAFGGRSVNNTGGDGVFAVGAEGSGAGNRGGDGIVAMGGNGASGATSGLAGRFNGDVQIAGTLSATTKMFRIDHPLDPENKYLNYISIESPDMMNVYNGNVTTDLNGEAVVTLPDYFQALNKDFRYQLTVIGQFAQAIVAEEISDNRFTIRTDNPSVKVSWQVTGIRKDPWAEKNRIKVEEEKSERERGFHLHPEVHNQPEEHGVEWARNPEIVKQMKEKRQKSNDR